MPTGPQKTTNTSIVKQPSADSEGWLESLSQSWPPQDWDRHGLILAVSGGADSMALLELTAELIEKQRLEKQRHQEKEPRKFPLVAHFNHELHPQAAEHADFVRKATVGLGWEFCVGKPDSPLESAGGGMELAARNARYTFLERVSAESGYRLLATAHTANDQAETVLHRICRGTGIRGLQGIQSQRLLSPELTLLRPLLGCWRAELVTFLQGRNHIWLEDPSNASLDFTRNRIRREVLPLLEIVHPGAGKNMARLAGHAAEVFALITDAADDFAQQAVVISQGRLEVDRALAAKEGSLVVQVALATAWSKLGWPQREMTAQKWDTLVELARSAEIARYSLPANLSVFATGSQLIIETAD